MKKFLHNTRLTILFLTSSLPVWRIIIRVIILITRRAFPLLSAAIIKIVIDKATQAYSIGTFDLRTYIILILLLIFNFLFLSVCDSIFEIIDKKQRETDVYLIAKTLQENTIDKMKYLDRSFFDISEHLDMISRGQSLNENVIYSIYINAMLLFGTVISFIGYGALLLSFQPLILAIVIPVEIIKFINDQKAVSNNDGVRRKITNLTRMRDYYIGLMKSSHDTKELKAYTAYDFFWSKYKAARNKAYKVEQKAALANRVRTFLISILEIVSDAIVYGIIVHCAVHGQITVGDVTFLFTAYSMVREGISGTFLFANDLYSTACNVSYIDELMNIENEIINDVSLVQETPIRNQPYKIEFKNVWFMYPGTEKYVLEDISFCISSPSKIALVGLNGTGKSTLIKLLLRLYDPNRGSILLNNKNIKEYNPLEYYNLFSLLFQNYFTYAVSLRENIGFYDDKKEDDEKIREALDGSQTVRFINKMSKGLDTEISKLFSEDGYIPSTGENQRIALARAIYHNRPIMILDEPSASIDAVAEHEILQYIDSNDKAVIKVIISHRLSNVSNCDMIIVLKDGRIVEKGTHRELVARRGLYAGLYSKQSSGYIGSKGEPL